MKKLVETINKKHLTDACIILSFILIAALSTIIIAINNKYSLSSDSIFHIKRITGLIRAENHGVYFPHLAFWNHNQSGNALYTFYPYLTILPMVWFFRLFSISITTINIVHSALILVAMLIGYYSSKNILKHKSRRYLFAILYGISALLTFGIIFRDDLGANLTMILLPIPFFGFLKLLKYNKWKQLALGITLMMYSHILGTIFTLIFLLIFGLVNTKAFINKKKLIALSQAVITCILLSAHQFVPMIDIMAKNKMTKPIPPQKIIGVSPLMVLILVGFVDLFGIIDSFINYKKENKVSHQLLWISILIILVSSKLIPWNSIYKSIADTIQYPYRLLAISNIIIVYLIAKTIQKNNYGIKALLVILLAFAMQGDLQAFSTIMSGAVANKVISNVAGNNGMMKRRYFTTSKERQAADCYINNSSQLKYIKNSPWPALNIPDYSTIGTEQYKYFSKRDKKLSNDTQNGTNNNGIKMRELGNGTFKFNNHHKCDDLITPVDKYNGISYRVDLDGKPVKYHKNKSNLLTISNVKAGQHKIRIVDKSNWAETISLMVSLLGIVLICMLKEKRKAK